MWRILALTRNLQGSVTHVHFKVLYSSQLKYLELGQQTRDMGEVQIQPQWKQDGISLLVEHLTLTNAGSQTWPCPGLSWAHTQDQERLHFHKIWRRIGERVQSQSLCMLKAQGLVLSTGRNQQVQRVAIRMPDHTRRDKASSLSGGSEVSSVLATFMSSNNRVAPTARRWRTLTIKAYPSPTAGNHSSRREWVLHSCCLISTCLPHTHQTHIQANK